MTTEIPCLLNFDNNCPETCPHHERSREIIAKGAKDRKITLKEFVREIRGAQNVRKLLASADLLLTDSASGCVRKDECEVAIVSVKNPSK